MSLRAIRDMVILTAEKEEEKTSAGIFILKNPLRFEMEPINVGVIQSVGEKVTELVVGDRVVYREGTLMKNGKRFNGDEYIDADNEPLIIVSEKDILAKFE